MMHGVMTITSIIYSSKELRKLIKFKELKFINKIFTTKNKSVERVLYI